MNDKSPTNSAIVPDPELTGWIRDIRRTIHQYPEPGYQEHRTRKYIAEKLGEIGVPVLRDSSKTGIIAAIGNESKDQPCIALRADMDGLPVLEKTGLSFTSKIPGMMHACGHDGHVAMLLGAAALLKNSDIPGKVVLFFQPAEESGNGAHAMIKEGALEGIQQIFAGHIDRHFNVGQIAAEPGLICAYTDPFNIKICGRGGHASRPHETVDSIVVASLLVMSIQTLVSREVNPSYPTVVSVGRIEGGSAHNVIAEQTSLKGTIRSTHPDIRSQIIAGLERMVGAMDDLYDVTTEITFGEGLPPVINDKQAAEVACEAVTRVTGEEGLVKQRHPSLGGEDFSFFLQRIPGCLVRFGAGGKDRADGPAHSPYFDFDEGVLPIGAAYLSQVAQLALHKLHTSSS